jgi:hypothetical protein
LNPKSLICGKRKDSKRLKAHGSRVGKEKVFNKIIFQARRGEL